MYHVTDGVFIHFAHHVRGHLGPCISLHGHTWLFEVTLGAKELDSQGFVIDFDELHAKVLNPCHQLLDHSLAVGEETFQEIGEALVPVGEKLVASRDAVHGHCGERQAGFSAGESLAGARNEWPGQIKLAVFPFTPTSERLAEWLAHFTDDLVGDERVRVVKARVVETLHPTESAAEYIVT
ncbi:MAG: 6-carboxytetrahydropterin synthase [Polyangiaceae bacterium]|nr:6-carboxytetrahydropterin synthase [Polyangiaceae bacterium]